MFGSCACFVCLCVFFFNITPPTKTTRSYPPLPHPTVLPSRPAGVAGGGPETEGGAAPVRGRGRGRPCLPQGTAGTVRAQPGVGARSRQAWGGGAVHRCAERGAGGRARSGGRAARRVRLSRRNHMRGASCGRGRGDGQQGRARQTL